MENASKALIIAGAILLAIVIISLGLIVVNNVRNVTDNTNLSEQEIQAFNAKFTAYEGTSVAGSRVNSLIQQVIATNSSYINDKQGTRVAIAFYTSYTYNASEQKNYIWLTTDDGGNLKATKTAKDNLKDGSSSVLKNDNGINSILNAQTTVTPEQYSVSTGKTYTVKLYYSKDGLVNRIVALTNE